MLNRQRLPKSVRIHIRLEKARIRKTTKDEKEQQTQLHALMGQYVKKT